MLCFAGLGFTLFRSLYKHELFEVDPAKLQCFFSSAFDIPNVLIFIHYSSLPLFPCEQEELGSALADCLLSTNSEETVFQQTKV